MNNFGKLFKVLLKNKNQIIISVILGTFTVFSNVALLGISAYLICRSAIEDSIAPLLVVSIGVRCFGMIRPVFRYLERLMSHNVTFKFLSELRRDYYSALEPLAPTKLALERKGDLFSRIVTDVDTLKNFYLRIIYPVAIATLTFFGGIIALSFFSMKATILFGIFYILGGVLLPFVMSKFRVTKEVVDRRSQLKTILVDSIKGMTELKSYNAVDLQKEKLFKASNELINTQIKKNAIDNLSVSLSSFLSNGCMLGLLIIVSYEISKNGSQLNSVYLATIVLIGVSSFEGIIPLANVYNEIRESMTSAKRLFDITKIKYENDEGEYEMGNSFDVTFDDVNFSYDDNKKLLEHLSFKIKEGSKVAIVGKSGIGKSTIVNLLLKFVNYESGSIKIGEHELKKLSGETCRNIFAVVPQSPYIFNATVKENILIAKPNATQEEIIEAVTKANIKDFIENLPNKYETILGGDGVTISGGQKSRLAIARAILRDSKIIILDEATSSLDEETEEAVLNDILKICENKTIIFITHKKSILSKFDEIIKIGS